MPKVLEKGPAQLTTSSTSSKNVAAFSSLKALGSSPELCERSCIFLASLPATIGVMFEFSASCTNNLPVYPYAP